MTKFAAVTEADLPTSLTRQWFQADSPKATKGATFGMYAVAINAETGQGMVIPLVNQSAADRAAELAATSGWTVNEVPDSRLVEKRVTGAPKAKLTSTQQAAMAALLAGTATDEQKAALATLAG